MCVRVCALAGWGTGWILWGPRIRTYMRRKSLPRLSRRSGAHACLFLLFARMLIRDDHTHSYSHFSTDREGEDCGITCTYIRTHTCVCIHMYVFTCMFVCTHTRTHTCIYADMETAELTEKLKSVGTNAHTHTRTDTKTLLNWPRSWRVWVNRRRVHLVLRRRGVWTRQVSIHTLIRTHTYSHSHCRLWHQ